MKHYRFILLFFCLFNVHQVFSQDTIKPTKYFFSGQHTIYGEILGSIGIYGSIGYDYKLKFKEKHGLAFKLAIEYIYDPYQYDGNTHKILASPEISYLYSFYKDHHIEFGAGFIYRWEFDAWYYKSYLSAISSRIGYRYQKSNGGFFFKIAFTPYFYEWGGKIFPWGGIAFGYTFK